MSIEFTKIAYIIPPTAPGADPGCTGAVYADDMDFLDTDLWAHGGTGLTHFNGGRWEVNVPGSNIYGDLQGLGKFTLSGGEDMSVCWAVEVDAVHYSVDVDANEVRCSFQFSEGFKSSIIRAHIKVQTTLQGDPNPGQLKYEVTGTGASIEEWHNPPAGSTSGYHVFKIDVNNTADTATLYVWNPSLTRWEWNGDTGGYVATGFDSDITDIDFYIWCDSVNDYIDCGVDYFYVNTGTVNIIP